MDFFYCSKIKIKIIGHMDFFYCKTFPLDLTACRREKNKNNSQLCLEFYLKQNQV
jgi:hypothetical protein